MNQKPEIQIVDVIVQKSEYSTRKHYYVVVDRMPEFIYHAGEPEKNPGWRGIKRKLTAEDSGFFDFLEDIPGSSDAFAGSKFDIKLDDGSTLHCHGQVWASFQPEPENPVVQIGVCTIEKLEDCYCFMGGYVLVEKLEAWLAINTPSQRYRKYDPRHTVAWLDKRAAENTGSWGERRVGAARARKLKKRGVTIRWRGESRTWYPWYERQKAQIEAEMAADGVKS